jgi:hypothetical protein
MTQSVTYRNRPGTYWDLRRKGIRAREALDFARTRTAWLDTYGGSVRYQGHDETERHKDELVRLLVSPDDFTDQIGDFDCDCGRSPNPDTSDARIFPGLCPDQIAEIRRADALGVVGIVGQAYVGGEWETVDSVWGFIGDDWDQSGYDADIMRGAMARADHETAWLAFCIGAVA